jgi:pilus assembly protein CpaB
MLIALMSPGSWGPKAMRGNVKIMLLLAVVCGGGAIWAGQSWLESETSARMRAIEAARPEIKFGTILVAARPLRYGESIGARDVKEIPWPGNELPPGSFATVADFTKDGERTVLFPIETSEPLLTAKITGPGERAALSRLIGEGNRAVSIRVNDVAGVSGFVLPGDHVDVVLTTAERADVILQDVRILSTDQSADERTNEPRLARTVTVEASPENAQRLVLAQTVGALSLVLRKAGSIETAEFRPLSEADLSTTNEKAVPVEPASAPRGATVWVRRATTLTQYSVPSGAGGPMQPISIVAATPPLPPSAPVTATAPVALMATPVTADKPASAAQTAPAPAAATEPR